MTIIVPFLSRMVILVLAALPTSMVKDSGDSVPAFSVTLNEIQSVCLSVVKVSTVVIGTKSSGEKKHLLCHIIAFILIGHTP